MHPAIVVVNDTIFPGPDDPFRRGLTPRETQTRIAFYIIALGTPLVGALIAISATKNWWRKVTLWTFPRLCALWFITVAAFASIVFFQPGQATRSTFVLAIIHGMVEISIASLLLGGTLTQTLIAAMVFALVDLALAFALANISHVFIVVAITGGVNDFLIPALLLYGRQPLLAIGASGHTVAAISVFTFLVHDYSIFTFTLVSFFSLWVYVGFIIAGIRQLQTSDEGQPLNPMKVPVSRKILAQLVLVSLVGSTLISMLLAYVVPTL